MAFEPIDKNFVSRNFNDRRVGGKPYGMQSQVNPEEGYGRWPKGLGGTKVSRKPKYPKSPMPARAVAIKHEVKGY